MVDSLVILRIMSTLSPMRMKTAGRTRSSLILKYSGKTQWLFRFLALAFSAFLTIAQADILYVSERYSNTIRRYDLNTGADLGIFATTPAPTGLAFDTSGNLYVSNFGQGTISKFTPDGVGSIFASGLFFAYGLTVDAAGNVFVSHPLNGVITKITPNGVTSGLSDMSGGPASPLGLATDVAKNLYSAGSIISRFAPDGTRSVFANTPAYGLAFDGAGNLFASTGAGDISKSSPTGVVTPFANGLNSPFGLAVDSSGNVFAAENGSKTIRRFTPDGNSSVFASMAQEPFFLAIQVIPEPASSALLILGLPALLLSLRRRP